MKLLAGLSVVVIALLVLIWLQMREEPAAPVAEKPTVQPVVTVAKADQSFQQAVEKIQKAQDAAAANEGKIDINSDAFFVKFDDLIPQMLTRNAAKCYTGGLNRVHRNQKVKLRFKDHIKNGVVTVTDLQLVADETTIHDKALVDCFMREVANTTWTDPELPDWDQDDELVIRPERGMKKFTKENMEYEGSGPDFTNVHPLAH
jgi:hypothetical protein